MFSFIGVAVTVGQWWCTALISAFKMLQGIQQIDPVPTVNYTSTTSLAVAPSKNPAIKGHDYPNLYTKIFLSIFS